MQLSKLKPTPTQAIIYLTVIYIIGVTGMLTRGTLDIFMFLVPVNIMLVVFVAAIYHKGFTKKFIGSCIAIYLGGYLIEWLGVKTGLVFGVYTYGEGLGFKIDGVPVIMGLNWLILVYGSLAVAGNYFKSKWLISLVAAMLMLLYDIFLEPSAICYGFWYWEQETVPLQNYVAWLVGAYLFCYLYIALNGSTAKNKVAEAIFWLQLGFFACLLMGKNY